MVNLEDGSLQFLNQTLHDAEMSISVWHADEPAEELVQNMETSSSSSIMHQSQDEKPRDEYLLIFQKLGIYVDANGLQPNKN